MSSKYWKETVSIALNDAGITAADEQIDLVAGAVESSHENYGMAHGHDNISSPMSSEVDLLKRQIAEERRNNEMRINGIKKGVAQRRGIDVSQVQIDANGKVTYDLK